MFFIANKKCSTAFCTTIRLNTIMHIHILSIQHVTTVDYQDHELQARCQVQTPVGSYTRTCSRQPAALYASSDARLAHAVICQIAVACTTVHHAQPNSVASQRHNLFYMLNHATARVSLENCDGFFVT